DQANTIPPANPLPEPLRCRRIGFPEFPRLSRGARSRTPDDLSGSPPSVCSGRSPDLQIARKTYMLTITRTTWRVGGRSSRDLGTSEIARDVRHRPGNPSIQPQAAQLVVQGPQADAQGAGREMAVAAAFAQDVGDHPALAGGHRLRQPSGGGVRSDGLGPEIEGGDRIRQVADLH